MKLRPVLLVLVLLSGFYYLTTRGASSRALAPWTPGWAHGISRTSFVPDAGEGSTDREIEGPLGNFHLTEASAAPAFDAEEQQNIAVYRKALPSVVNITSTAVSYDFFNRPVPQQGQGSGFVLDKEGHILTNNHVIDNAQRVEVTLSDKHKYKATVIGIDTHHDLALLSITAPGLVPATLSDSGGLVVGQKVYAIGNPFGLSGTMTRGMISAIRSIGTSGTQGGGSGAIEDAIQTDAAINPGNSGGPLLNSRGEVIGITTLIASSGADQSAGIGFAIPINTAKAVLDDFAHYGKVRRPSLDIETLPIGPDIAEQIGLPADYGILVQRTMPGGAAAKAGLRGGNQRVYMGNTPIELGGDLIVGLDGQEVQTPQDLGAALTRHKAGDVVTVTIFRGQRQLNLKVTLGDAKDAVSLPGRAT